MRTAWLACCVVGLAPIAHAQELSFSDAVARAADGPTVEAGLASTRAAERSVGPASQLPDPELVLGLENVPIEGPDAYLLDRDFMTMQSVGVMQEMPSAGERRARRSAAEAEVSRAEAAVAIARLEARLGAAQAWIGAHYAERRLFALQSLEREARASADALRARLASGGSVDAAIAAEIGAARIADRLGEAQAALIAARGELWRWLGEASADGVSGDPPDFHIDADSLRAGLQTHPVIAAYQAEQAMTNAGLALARAERVPDWSWSLMYQHRDRDFGDMASLEVRIGLPLFQSWRQGPLIDARRADQARVAAERAATEREQQAAFDAGLAQYSAIEASLARARDTRVPLARQRAAAAQGAFAAGTTTASDFISARLEAIEAELDLIDLEERRARLGAALSLPFEESAP